MSVTVLAVRTPVDICPSRPWSAAAFFLPMRAASGVKNGAVTVVVSDADADVCRCFSPKIPEDAAAAVADLSRLLPPLPVRHDDDEALLRFRRRWLPCEDPEAVADATALATAVAAGPPCIVIPSSLSCSPKKPPDVDRGLVGATIQLFPCLVIGLDSEAS